MKKKILVIVYNIQRAREHEWYVQLLDRDLFEIEFAVINFPDSYLVKFLRSQNIKVHTFNYAGKKDLFNVTRKLYSLIRKNRYHIVHSHLFEATISGTIAAFLAGVKHRIITRHHSDFHHVYFPSAVRYDKLVNFLSTKIIAVSENIKQILINREGVAPGKITVIHHGIDLNEFDPDNISHERIKKIRIAYNIPETNNVIGVVSRFIYWKGLQYIIPAFKKVLSKFPDSILVLANAQGPFSDEVNELLKEINPATYRLVKFENDMPALYRIFDCFVHTPVSETAEAFGQAYIEALAAGIPSVFTLSGVATEFAVNEVNCLIVPHKDENAIAAAVMKLLNEEFNTGLMKLNGQKIVALEFNMHTKYEKISTLYSGLK